MGTNLVNTKVSQYDDAYVLSNTWATYEAQSMKNLSNIEAELKKKRRL